jgi:hypothetical protein
MKRINVLDFWIYRLCVIFLVCVAAYQWEEPFDRFLRHFITWLCDLPNDILLLIP